MKTIHSFYNKQTNSLLLSLMMIMGMLAFNACKPPIDIDPEPDQLMKVFGERVGGKLEIAHKIIRTQDGNMLVAGKWQEAAFLLKLTTCADSLWLQTYTVGNATVFYDVLEMPNGNLLAVGKCEQCSESGAEKSMLVYQTNAEGGAVGNPVILNEQDIDAQAKAIAATQDGYIIAGTSNRAALSAYAGISAHLYKLDQSLNVQWTKFYDAGYFDNVSDIVSLSQGGFAFAGRTGALGALTSQLWYTDVEGNLQWTAALFGPGNQQNVAASLVELPTGKLLVSGTNDQDVFVAKVETDSGQVESSMQYGSDRNDRANEIVLLDNGQILVAGLYGAVRRASYATSAWVMLLDAQLGLNEEYFFNGYLTADEAMSIVPLAGDGSSFAFAGSRRFSNSQDIVIGIKPDACTVPE